MSDSLNERLNKILPKVISDEFLSGGGIGNEIAFYVFDYPAEDELRVRDYIRTLIDHIPKQKHGMRVKHVNQAFGQSDSDAARKRGRGAEKGPRWPAPRIEGGRSFCGGGSTGSARSRHRIRRWQCLAVASDSLTSKQPSRGHG
jgi:hypothetical protein